MAKRCKQKEKKIDQWKPQEKAACLAMIGTIRHCVVQIHGIPTKQTLMSTHRNFSHHATL